MLNNVRVSAPKLAELAYQCLQPCGKCVLCLHLFCAPLCVFTRNRTLRVVVLADASVAEAKQCPAGLCREPGDINALHWKLLVASILLQRRGYSAEYVSTCVRKPHRVTQVDTQK
jgi:hypothetical protein